MFPIFVQHTTKKIRNGSKPFEKIKRRYSPPCYLLDNNSGGRTKNGLHFSSIAPSTFNTSTVNHMCRGLQKILQKYCVLQKFCGCIIDCCKKYSTNIADFFLDCKTYPRLPFLKLTFSVYCQSTVPFLSVKNSQKDFVRWMYFTGRNGRKNILRCLFLSKEVSLGRKGFDRVSLCFFSSLSYPILALSPVSNLSSNLSSIYLH